MANSNNKEDYFDSIYLNTYKDLQRYVLKFVNNRRIAKDVVEDVIQDTFLEFYKKIDILMEHENICGWLYVTCRFKLLKYLDKYKQQRVDIDTLVLMDYQDHIDEFIIYRVLSESLTDDEFSIFILHTKFGYKFSEIAYSKNIKVGTCKMRFYRLVNKLQCELDSK